MSAVPKRWLRVKSVGSALVGVAATAMLIVAGVTQYRLATRLRLVEDEISTLKQRRLAPMADRRFDIKTLAPPAEPVSLDGAAVKGQRTARIAVIEYADFQCEYCGVFVRDALPELERAYLKTGKALFAFRHLPLSRMHPDAQKAAEAAECASRQGRFWEMHDILFQNPRSLGIAALRKYAAEIGLNGAALEGCLQGQVAEKVATDAAFAEKLGISGTPTFLVGPIQSDGRVKVVQVIVGTRSLAEFAGILDQALVSAEGR